MKVAASLSVSFLLAFAAFAHAQDETLFAAWANEDACIFFGGERDFFAGGFACRYGTAQLKVDTGETPSAEEQGSQ